MSEQQVTEIKFDELHENDTVVLETAHNVYTFQLRNFEHQMGELAGGHVGEPSSAILGGTVEEAKVIDDRLKVGGRALFFSSVPQDQMAFKRIVTSPISKILLTRAA